jgi:hypothetical protein
MEPTGSLVHLQAHSTCPYPEPEKSNQCFTTPFLKYPLDTVLPSTPRSLKCFFPSGLPTQTLYVPHLLPLNSTCPAPIILLYLKARTMNGEQHITWSPSSFRLFHCRVTSPLLGSNIFLIILLSDTLRLRSSLGVRDETSHPYKTTGKIIVLYIFICMLRDSKLEDRKFYWDHQFGQNPFLPPKNNHAAKYSVGHNSFP